MLAALLVPGEHGRWLAACRSGTGDRPERDERGKAGHPHRTRCAELEAQRKTPGVAGVGPRILSSGDMVKVFAVQEELTVPQYSDAAMTRGSRSCPLHHPSFQVKADTTRPI